MSQNLYFDFFLQQNWQLWVVFEWRMTVGGQFDTGVNLTPRVLRGQFDTKSVKESI